MKHYSFIRHEDDVLFFFRLLFEVVQKSTQGRSRHITMLALSDLIGNNLLIENHLLSYFLFATLNQTLQL